MIIGGILSLFVVLLAILSLSALNTERSFTFVIATIVFSAIGGIVELVAGIVGFQNWNNPAKANVCMGMGIAVMGLSVLSFFMGADSSNSANSDYLSLVLGLILPALYLVGVVQLKRKNA